MNDPLLVDSYEKSVAAFQRFAVEKRNQLTDNERAALLSLAMRVVITCGINTAEANEGFPRLYSILQAVLLFEMEAAYETLVQQGVADVMVNGLVVERSVSTKHEA